MKHTTWRDRSIAVIAEVRREHPDATGEELRGLLFDAYPFGMRQYWPYKVWCKCVREACHIVTVRPLSELPMFEGG